MAKKFSKRYKAAIQSYDVKERYDLESGVKALQNFPKPKFDETVEVYARLGVDPRQSSQMVRGTVSLPNGSGKSVKVIVFTSNPEAALEAGADEAGLEDLIAKVQEGYTEFDVAIATPDAMKEVRKVARILGPRGLMPNPKSGTVTDDIGSAIKEVKGGRVEYKMDKTANVAVVIGKRSFTPEALAENARTAIDSLARAKPDGFKGPAFIKSLTLSATMSPGVKLDVKQLNLN
ncbi:MAG: 50S ribosomal protein L1 [Opitutales bacterium]